MLRGLGGNPPDKEVQFLVRSTTACLKSEELKLAALPIPDLIEVGATELALDRMILGLQPSQLVVLSGEQQDAPGVRRQELLELQEIIHHQGLTTLLFREQSSRQGLQYAYLRHTVTLNANVARATHGETKREVLGSGAAAQAFQKFLLKQAPLTYVSAPTPSGSASTLELRVNDVRWDESPGFYRVSPRQRTFVTRRDDDGKTTVKMGNGVTGARLPSGVENITAKYRVGLGLGGMVKAGQISLLLTRPPGLKEVVNPLPATGGADPENRDQARENAPLTVLTLDRIVSLQDFEDYTRAYPGIGKAQAVWLWDGEGKVIHLTIAGADGGPVPPGSTLYDNLRDSIKTARDPGPHVRISSYEPLTFDLKARLLINRAYFADKVKAEVTAKVNAAFSFGCRAFGRAVTKSEVFAVMQGVEGVEAVDLDKFHLSSKEATLEDRLPARTAEWNDTHSEIRAGELLLVNPRKIQLTEIAP
jgi:predicted phage baseplate assembly protein